MSTESDSTHQRLDDDDQQCIRHWAEIFSRFQSGIAATVVGQSEVVQQLLIALVARGHCLTEGVAGSGKTLIGRELARHLNLTFRRIQLTPDLSVTDLISAVRSESAAAGIGANILLVDGIYHGAPKVQTLLMNVLQDRFITIHGSPHPVVEPFMLVAGHDPRELGSSQGLPEAQLDRFLMRIVLRYPDYKDEYRITELAGRTHSTAYSDLIASADLRQIQAVVTRVVAAPAIIHYVLRLVRSTRVYEGEDHDFVLEFVSRGAGPRAARSLMLAATARAVLFGRFEPLSEDVRAVAHPVLRHRIVANANAEANGITTDQIIDRLLEETPERVPGDEVPPS